MAEVVGDLSEEQMEVKRLSPMAGYGGLPEGNSLSEQAEQEKPGPAKRASNDGAGRKEK